MKFLKQTIRDIHLEGRTVLLRADYNVPLQKDGTISDDLRIRASLPTIEYLLKKRCKVAIISHLGRPDGKRDERYTLEPAAARLAQLLERDVRFVDDCWGDKVSQVMRLAKPGSITVLENLRFYNEEEANDETFARNVAKSSRADYFVQDGFGVVHRAHASTSAITHYLPSVAGLLLEREVQTIAGAVQAPDRPLVAIMGGAKVSDKIKVIEQLVKKADKIIIGGAMANTFLQYKGVSVGKSKVEGDVADILDAVYASVEKKLASTKNILKAPQTVDEFILLPQDVAIAHDTDDSTRRCVSIDQIPSDAMALDIGDATIERYCDELANAKTVIWNGPLGFSENPTFAHGSARVALTLAQNTNITSVVGGGDTADFVLKWDANDGASFTHVSTGGGAGLDLMAGAPLPGLESLLDATRAK
ncbi:phosphoglycerate kinase [Candidatus Saccharibacteria bacterium]|nr:phosphoglycerate kinase [Candidatus Saccharibacteria bacterium]